MDAGRKVLTSASAGFRDSDVGKPIIVPGEGSEAMLGIGIARGWRSGSRVHLVLAQPATGRFPIYAHYWRSNRPVVDRLADCAISGGSNLLTCSRQSFTDAYRWALAVASGAGPLDPATNAHLPLVSRINAVTRTALTLDRSAVVSTSNQNLMVWLRYEEEHGRTEPGQSVIDFATDNAPLPESLNVSVGPYDAVDVAATDLTTEIAAVSGGKAILAARAARTLRSGSCRFGTDNGPAFQSALDHAMRGPVAIAWPWGMPSAGNGRVEIPPGHAYYVGSPLIYDGSNLELNGSGAAIYYGGTGTFLRLGEAVRDGKCPERGLTAIYHVDALNVIGSFNAAVGIAVPCAGQTQIDSSLIQGFIENLDVGTAGANGTSPDTKVTRTFLDRGITNLWVHTADLFSFSDGGYYGYRDRGMVLCGDDSVDTLCHSMKIDSAEGAAHFLTAAAGLDVGNIDGFDFRNVYDEPGVAQGLPEGSGPALRFGYIGSPHGGVVASGTWSGNKVDTAVQFNALGSSGTNSDIVFLGNYLVNWNIGFDLTTARQILALNRFEPQTLAVNYIGVNSTDSVMDNGSWSPLATVQGPAAFQTPNSSNRTMALRIQASRDQWPRYSFLAGTGIQVGAGSRPPKTVIDEGANLHGQEISASAMSAGPFFSFSTIYSAASKPIPGCDGTRLHWRACVSDAPVCTNGAIYGAGGGALPCELWCNGKHWIQSGSGC